MTYGLTTTPLAEVEIFVRKEQRRRSLQYLEQYQSAQENSESEDCSEFLIIILRINIEQQAFIMPLEVINIFMG